MKLIRGHIERPFSPKHLEVSWFGASIKQYLPRVEHSFIHNVETITRKIPGHHKVSLRIYSALSLEVIEDLKAELLDAFENGLDASFTKDSPHDIWIHTATNSILTFDRNFAAMLPLYVDRMKYVS